MTGLDLVSSLYCHSFVGKTIAIDDNPGWSKHFFKDPRFAQRSAKLNAKLPTGKDLVKWKYQTYMKDYMRCTWGVDVNIGRVVETLKRLGLTDNTIVMYS